MERVTTARCDRRVASEMLLAQLGLSTPDLAALAKQGFVSGEYRNRGARRCGPYYKLRWRLDGAQRVLYLGCNPVLAEQVQSALAAWQAARREQRASIALQRSARCALHAAKCAAALLLERDGRYFHGYSVRRRRRGSDHDQASSTTTATADRETILYRCDDL